MALGKPRSARRSSSSSSTYCTSTITMLVFIVFAVIALWMLTSSSVVPPQSTTTRTSNAFSTTSSSSSSSSQDSKSVKNKDPPVFEDTQGDLPDDAIKGDTKSDAAKAGQEGKQALLERARDPEVTATAEQQEDGGGGNVNGNGNSKEEEKGKSELNMQVNMQEKESESNLEKNGEIENTQKGKEEESSSENQNQSQSQMENPQQSNKETEESNTKQESQQQEAEMENKETQQQQQQIQQESQEEVHESIQQRHEETLQNQQSTEAESTGNTQQEETGSEHQEKSQQGQLETENQENTQQNQQETESESQEQNQQSSQSDSENGQKPQEMSDTTTDHQQQQLQEDSAQDNQQSQSQQLQEDSGQDTQQSQSQQEDSQHAQSQQENTHTENQQEVAQKEGKASGIPKESNESKESWSTQENQSENQKERRKEDELSWELCHVTAGADYIPCLDNEKALRQIHSTRHYEHRERHCPEEGPTCLVPLPVGYKRSIEWPKSRDKIWYHNVPHTKLAEVKGHQNWVKVTGEFLTFPGGGTQFIHGALHYIDFIEKSVPNIAWGKRTRVVLDVGCGVASFGGYLFDRDVLTMSFAPKDEHEAQVQFALERGIPAISAVMGSQRLQFPSRVFDIVHCARCRVPWHVEGGMLLLELNRVLRPGGYFVWSATPVYQKLDEDVQIWKEMSKLTQSMCWELVTIKKDKLNGVGAAIYRKPDTNDCYEHRKHNKPPMCKDDDDANAAWYVPLQACMHRAPVDESARGSRWPEKWPARVHKPPYWLNNSQKGIYGKYAPDDFSSDHEHWKRVVTKTYMSGLGISWSNVRNVMDMRAVYGGFAAALKDLKVWVMNVVNVDCPDTLPIIYERGLFGIYHDWCESFSTYPRTYDLLHADHLFSSLKKRCNLLPVIAEVDRIVRPGGKFIVRDEVSTIGEIENMLKSLHWEIHLSFSKGQDGILSAQKSDWRPQTSASSS